MESAAMVRPERDEELRIEATSRATGGPWAYTGTRECAACEADTVPVHPDGTDRQTCRDCGTELPGEPVTWAIRDIPEGGAVFVLRHGDYCQSATAPARSVDDDVNRVLAQGVWMNLEHGLHLTAFYATR